VQDPDVRAVSTTRPEIQALRAVAVLLVLAFHLWPGRVPGGYVGVDVFFVISGFLITAHLMREASSTGRIRLGAFWARRARRLLPAAMLVLIVTAIATYLIAPHGLWQRYFEEIGASGLYVENLLLAVNSVDYLAASDPSPVQHFWSLSAEEQFYLVWPLIILLTVLAARGRGGTKRAVLIVLAIVTALSLVASVLITDWAPAPAYFLPFTRAWEFGAGALLAFAPALPRGAIPALLGWLGFVAIAMSAVAYDATTPFPGFAALLPVAGAVAVVASGPAAGAWSTTELSQWKPIQWTGDISYSLYLWHWPLIVLLPFAIGRPMGTVESLAVLAASFVLAGLTKTFVEDPARLRGPLARGPARWTLAATLAAMTVVVATCAVGVYVGRPVTPLAPVVPADASCFGAGATLPGADCEVIPPESWAAAAAFARTDSNDAGEGNGWEHCQSAAGAVELKTCILGNFDDPERTIVIVGDSHAAQLAGAFSVIANERHWNVITYVRSACAGTGDSSVFFPQREWDQGACAEWGREVADTIIADPEIDAVVMSGYAATYGQDTTGQLLGVDPYLALWGRFTAAGKQVYVVSDTPRPIGDVPTCLESTESIADCSVPRSTALYPNVMLDAAAVAANPDVHVIDLTDRYCFDGVCPPYIGDVIVYADDSHLTKTYSKTLAPFILEAMGGVGG